MTNSYLNIITFLLTTLLYYLTIKPSYTYEISIDPTKQKEFKSNSYMYLVIYFLLVMVIQFIVNSSIISSTCGGSITENMGTASVLTFLPWTLIFGVIIVILIIYPGFKSAFSDVIGYFWVSISAKKIITELLVDPKNQKKMDEDTTSTPEQKEAMITLANTIIKICGNNSLLINQIVPSNFKSYWNILTPLLKPKYQTENPDTEKIRNELFEIVVKRDNIGEAVWYIYTGLLLTLIVQFKIKARGCVSNPKTVEENFKRCKYAEQKSISTNTTNNITS
jgi:hypothetical protein